MFGRGCCDGSEMGPGVEGLGRVFKVLVVHDNLVAPDGCGSCFGMGAPIMLFDLARL
jgi:hypothetical protein